MILSLLIAFITPKVELDVIYSQVAGQSLKLDIYHSTSSFSGYLDPAVLVIHGGAWMSGNRKDKGIVDLCEALARNGFLAASVQYRLAPKHKWPAMLDDVQTAVRYLRENAKKFKIDPDRIGAAGASAGGHLSLLLGMRDTRDPAPAEYPKFSSRIGAIFNLFGPTDLWTDFPSSLDFLYEVVLGKKRIEAEKEIKEASPINFVSKDTAPVFIFHGREDKLVPIIQSERLEKRLKEVGIPVETAYIDGLGHGVQPPQTEKGAADVMSGLNRGIEFLKKHLKPKSTTTKQAA